MPGRHAGDPRCPTTNKITYMDAKSAHAEAKFMRKRYKGKVKEYQCRYCLAWHIGHWRPESRRQIKPWNPSHDKLPTEDNA